MSTSIVMPKKPSAVGGFDRGASPDWLLVAGMAFPRRPRALQREGSLLLLTIISIR
jgi:hypothetical protein